MYVSVREGRRRNKKNIPRSKTVTTVASEPPAAAVIRTQLHLSSDRRTGELLAVVVRLQSVQ